MKTNPNYVRQEHEKLYNRLMLQMKRAETEEEQDFLWEYLKKMSVLMSQYENKFIHQ